MTTDELLTWLQAHEVRLSAQGGQLQCDAPKGALTPELLAAMKEHKAELLARLSVPDLHPGDRVVWTMTPPVEAGHVTSEPGWTEFGWFVNVKFESGKLAACSVEGLRKETRNG